MTKELTNNKMETEPRFKPGDVITQITLHRGQEPIYRRILEIEEPDPPKWDKEIEEYVEESFGYIWEYADLPSGEKNNFTSRWSNDPTFSWWEKVENYNDIKNE